MACTKEEIERKRLAALQKRQSRISSPLKSASLPSTSYSSNVSPLKTVWNNAPKLQFHPYSKPGNSVQKSAVPVDKVISGTVYLISKERFEVNPSEFCTPLINIFKTLPSKSYDPSTKLWNFSIDDYPELMKKVAPLSPHIVLGTIPDYVFKILREPEMDPSTVDLSPIESTLRNKLMPFQEEGVRFAIAKRGRCMIADDMGLGKTFQALAVASYYRHNWPLLIITTSSMRETWQSKVHELLPSVPMMNVVCLNGSKDLQLMADRQTEVVIASFKLTGMHGEALRDKKFGFIIIDESQSLKSSSARVTRAAAATARNARRSLLLSGSPALSRPAELHAQLHIMQPDLCPTYTEFGKRYCAGKLTKFGWDMTGQSNLAELQIILHKKFLIRRTKDQVLTDLQEKTREVVILEPSLLDYTQEDKKELSQMAENYKRTKSSDKHAALLSFFSQSARIKIPAVCKYVRQMVSKSPETKFLVFAHHKPMIEALCLTLDELQTSYICIVGSVPTSTRAELVDRFQHSERCRAAVLSITAANSGLTLTAASLVLFAELHWNPGILSQAESRAHRLGQLDAVRARYLLAPGTADDHIWPLLQDKLNVLNEIGLSKDSFDGTKKTHQESRNNITQYLSPASSRCKNDYIPGTNVRKDGGMCEKENAMEVSETADKSFLDDDEDDELLANLDL